MTTRNGIFWFSTSSTSLRYAAGGAGSDWIVMLHEIGGTLETWTRVADGLGGRFRTLPYDQRGCGLSEKIRGVFTFAQQVDELHALLQALGIECCHLAGVAIGSALAVRFAARWPARVRSLVLASPALKVDEDRRAYLHDRAAKVEAEGMRATVDATLGNSWPPEATRDPVQRAEYRARFLGNDPTSYAAINRAFVDFDATTDLARLTCPTLVIGGAHDKLRKPREVERVAHAIAGAQFKLLDTGHVIPAQAPDEMLAAMLAFYDGQGC